MSMKNHVENLGKKTCSILSHLPFCTEHAHTLIFVILAVEKEVAEINCMYLHESISCMFLEERAHLLTLFVQPLHAID